MWKLLIILFSPIEGVITILIHELIFLSVRLMKFLLFILSNIPKKKKDLIKDFLLFNFPFKIKWAFKPFINQLDY
jgi:hypothetical protein